MSSRGRSYFKTVNISSLVAIKLTSALALVLLSQGKTATTMILGYLFFDGRPNVRQLTGAAVAIVSLGAYSYGSASVASKARQLREQQLQEQQEQQEPLRGG